MDILKDIQGHNASEGQVLCSLASTPAALNTCINVKRSVHMGRWQTINPQLIL